MKYQGNKTDVTALVAYAQSLEAENERLRNDLAEVDGLLACHAHKLDPNPREKWPKNSVLGKAVDRHNGALADAQNGTVSEKQRLP